MNKDSFSQIWRTLNTVRGSVSGADYPLIVLPALILKLLDVQKKEILIEGYKEIYSPSRLFATYGVTDRAEDIINYLLEIEKEQGRIKGGYLGEASVYLDRIPERDFSNILQVIANLEVSGSEEIYALAEEIIRNVAISYGKVANLFLSTTCVRQVEKIALGEVGEEDKVLDGFAGTGISALNATKGKGILTLVESNPRMACIAEMMCILSGAKARICINDTFGFYGDEKFDKATMEPPFAMRLLDDTYRTLPYYDSDSDVMSLKYALSKIKEDGKAVVLCPGGVLFRGGRTEAGRKVLLENNNVDTVIQMPARSIYGTTVSTAVLVLKKKRSEDTILFIDASKLVEYTERDRVEMILAASSEEMLNDIISRRKEVEGVSKLVELDEVHHHEGSLVLTQYFNSNIVETKAVDIQPLIEKNTTLQNQLNSLEEELANVRKKFLNSKIS